MIPHTSAGVQPWAHQPRALNRRGGGVDGSRAPSRAASHVEKSPMAASLPQSKPQTVIDLTASEPAPQESEHPAKRQKLDVGVGVSAADGKTVPRGAEGRGASGPAAWRAPPPVQRARPAWSFQELMPETCGGSPAAGSHTLNPASPPSFPIRPWKYMPSRNGSSVGGSREGSPERQVQTTPYRLETPAAAPVLKDDKVADFSPWTGNHPEDVLNEQTAKQGHYDRTQVSQNESNTARPSLYAQLRHRSGLQVLSSVFAAALEKRQACSKVTAASTFKPPPRVTLTDNKREAWLRDLANPSVPLRRLSRTIPHGIRGKLLLDQCLSKWIPVGRAVWLAKCVGANEIRAFKRKGTSGALALGLETKWVRDWTTNVQQFIEGVIATCGQPEWKSRITYAVRLTGRLFFEHLLDQDHHLDWFLFSLETASLDSLPIWLMMLGVYWDSIVRYRRRGRKLIEVLLEKLRQVAQTGQKELLKPIIDRLSHFVKKLVHEQSSSAVIPRSWDTHKSILSSCLNLGDYTDEALFQALADRNARLQRPKDPGRVSQRSPQREVIRLLDSACSKHDLKATSEACLSTIDDSAALVSKVLEWTSTSFRQGLVRVYVAVRLLRKWRQSGIDIDSHIFSFLLEARDQVGLHMNNVYHVISELVRSQTFSVGRYLQWLMARGVVGDHQHTEHKTVASDVELLRHLPAGRLPEHVRSLRNTLMLRAGFSPSQEDFFVEALKSTIRQRLPGIFSTEPNSGILISENVTLLNHSRAVKSEIGQWIRYGVTRRYRCLTKDIDESDSSGTVEMSSLTSDEFFTVRNILETVEDLSMLADVLSDASTSDNVIVLASAVDTLNYHFDSFTVIGAMTDLWRSFIDACTRVKSAGLPTQDLLFSLVELGLRLPNETNAVAVLRHELSRLDRKSTLAASSPVSDHMAETLSCANRTFNEDLDQFLSSGNSMDESTLATVFETLCRRLESTGEGQSSANDTCRYLAQLRSFNPKLFDLLLVRWVSKILKSSPRPKLSKILAPLIGVGCVTLQALFALTKKLLHPESGSAIPDVIGLRLDLLQLLSPTPPAQHGSLDLVSYRFRIAQQEFLSKHSEETLGMIHDTATCFSTQAIAGGMDTVQSSLDAWLIPLLRDLLVLNPQSVAERCVQKLSDHYPASMGAVQKALNLLLGFNEQSGQDSSLSEAEEAIKMANDFSLPFCQMKLQILFNAESGEEMKSGIVDVMFKAALADVRCRRSHWADLVALMSQDAVQQIRQRAEKGFLSVAFSDTPMDDSPVEKSNLQDTARIYLTIVEELAYSIPDAGVPSMAPLLVEKMNVLLHKLVVAQTSLRNVSENRGDMMADQIVRSLSVFERNFAFWFTALLRMIVIHRSAFNSPSAAAKPSVLLDQARLLIAICCIALSRPPSSLIAQSQLANCPPSCSPSEQQRERPATKLQTYALDVAACLVDTLPEEARQQCARFLKERCPSFLHVQNDCRLLYLLGPMTDVTSSSQSLPVSASSPATSGSAPTPTSSANLVVGAPAGLPSASPLVTTSTGPSEDPSYPANRLRIQHRGRIVGPYPLRPWEMLEGAAPIVGVNDTAIGLGYFGARKARD